MSTPDASPVEVEGGPSNDALADQMDQDADRAHDGGYFATATGYRLVAARLRALPAAPTTPDIADERVRLIRARIQALHDQAIARAMSGNCRFESAPLYELLHDPLLATPSTPGAGQGDPFAAVKALPEWAACVAAEQAMTDAYEGDPGVVGDAAHGRLQRRIDGAATALVRAIRKYRSAEPTPPFARYRTGGTVVSGEPYESFPWADAELDDALRGVPITNDAPTPTPTDQTKERDQ